MAFLPTAEMANNARMGLRMRDQAQPAQRATQAESLTRARQFINRELVTIDVVRKTYAFLTRARVYYVPGVNRPGTQAYLMWGGDAALRWAMDILANQSEM